MSIIYYVSMPLGILMKFCYNILGNYGLAIILFTLFTKFILLPMSVWVHKDSIKMVKMQPEINRIKAKYYGDQDTISEELAKTYKKYKYNPLKSLLPLFVQILLLLGLVSVIYHPLNYILALPKDIIKALTDLTAELTGADKGANSFQLKIIETIKNSEFTEKFRELSFSNIDNVIADIKSLNLNFLGFDISAVPSAAKGKYLLFPLIAGFSAWLLCFAQNNLNVLQSEQGKVNKYGMMIFSVGISLFLGYSIPSGVAIYWIFSNLFSIIQLLVLNKVIDPKKHVDYKELEESRKELAALNSLGESGENEKQYKQREKADYKRFFSIENKHIVFYSEKSGFYKYYEALIEQLLLRSNVNIHYITNDPNDIIFEIAKKQERIKPYYIGIKKMIPLMMKMDADIVVMTTPDLDKYFLKRSLVRKDVEYVYVPHVSMSVSLCLQENALDNFDTIFSVGPHVEREVRETEQVYGLKPKTIVHFGYPLQEKINKLYEELQKQPKKDKKRLDILIAPSWQEDNILDSCIDELVASLYKDEFHLIVRPHPEYMKRYKPRMDAIVERHKDKIGEGLTFELDFSTNKSTYESDLLITDWSGISIEYAFATKKPVLYINTKMKVMNPNWQKIPSIPTDITYRDKIGISLEKSEVNRAYETVKTLLSEADKYKEIITEICNNHFYSLDDNGKTGALYLIRRLKEKQAERKNNQ